MQESSIFSLRRKDLFCKCRKMLIITMQTKSAIIVSLQMLSLTSYARP
jgi:hypothetical protein